jgi:peptidylprolyl isomerase
MTDSTYDGLDVSGAEVASRPSRSFAGALFGVLVAVTTLAACTEEPELPSPVVVRGEAAAAPTLEYETPLVVDEAVVEVIWEGTGPRVVDGQPILVNYYAEHGEDGSVINETYSTEPKPYLLTAEELGVDIYSALSGKRVGSRVLHVAPAGPGETSATVAVFDLLATRASGEEVPPREGLPVVTLSSRGVPTVELPEGPPPTELQVQPLIRGSGVQVMAGQVITVQFLGVTWEGVEVDSTWGPGELPVAFPIGVGSVIAGWDEGLIEQTVGSQVLLVVPPHLGWGGSQHEFADQTLVFVVDILAVTGGVPVPTVEPTPTEAAVP